MAPTHTHTHPKQVTLPAQPQGPRAGSQVERPAAGTNPPETLLRIPANKLPLLPAPAGPCPASRPCYVRVTQVGSWDLCHVGQRCLEPHLTGSPRASWGGSPLTHAQPSASSPRTWALRQAAPSSPCLSCRNKGGAEPFACQLQGGGR
jgi:hypothetical protein